MSRHRETIEERVCVCVRVRVRGEGQPRIKRYFCFLAGLPLWMNRVTRVYIYDDKTSSAVNNSNDGHGGL